VKKSQGRLEKKQKVESRKESKPKSYIQSERRCVSNSRSYCLLLQVDRVSTIAPGVLPVLSSEGLDPRWRALKKLSGRCCWCSCPILHPRTGRGAGLGIDGPMAPSIVPVNFNFFPTSRKKKPDPSRSFARHPPPSTAHFLVGCGGNRMYHMSSPTMSTP
jgi:hypothetical protein